MNGRASEGAPGGRALRTVPVGEAVGCALAHDVTEVDPGVFKGRAFARGHVVRAEDLPRLRRCGKEHLFVLELGADEIHEDEAAPRLAAALCGDSMCLVAYLRTGDGEVPLVGLPACALAHEATVFDLLLPRLLAGERIGRDELAELGHGGLCLGCDPCRFPVCPFGAAGT